MDTKLRFAIPAKSHLPHQHLASPASTPKCNFGAKGVTKCNLVTRRGM